MILLFGRVCSPGASDALCCCRNKSSLFPWTVLAKDYKMRKISAEHVCQKRQKYLCKIGLSISCSYDYRKQIGALTFYLIIFNALLEITSFFEKFKTEESLTLSEFALKEYFLGFNGFPKYFLVSTIFTLSTSLNFSLKYRSKSGLQHKLLSETQSISQSYMNFHYSK
jgi:hypothetical protein